MPPILIEPIPRNTVGRTLVGNQTNGTKKPFMARKGTKKSRSGCVTCKVRRVKCDEKKPACEKCVTTGRSCDYLDCISQPIMKTTTAPLISNACFRDRQFLDFSGNSDEHRFLLFFYTHTGPTISGCYDSIFWNELLPQVGRLEPAVQHSMVAIAAVHYRLESLNGRLKGVPKKTREEDENFEIKQYNKALHGLQKHISASGVKVEVTLTCCILLICLEILRGRVDQAILHLRGGFTILDATKQPRRLPTTNFRFRNLASESSEITRKLKDMFTRVRLQGDLSASLGPIFEDEDFSSVPQIALSTPFSSLEDARSSLVRILALSLRFIESSLSKFYSRSSAKRWTDPKINPLETHTWMMTQFSEWSRNFEVYMATTNSVSDRKFRNGCALLRIQHLSAETWHSTILSPTETIYDTMHQQYSSLVLLASSLVWEENLKPTTMGIVDEIPFTFTFEMGAIAPLYFTAVSCRDRKIRRDAIRLLASYKPRREGLWDADLLGFAARRVVEIEEARLPVYSETLSHTASYLPEEEDRIIDVKLGPGADEGIDSFTVTYISKPELDSDNFLFRREEVVVDDNEKGGYRLAKVSKASLRSEDERNNKPRLRRVDDGVGDGEKEEEVVSCYGIVVGEERSRHLRFEVVKVPLLEVGGF